MKKNLINLICFGLVISLFSACSNGNKFASSFGKRKYLKGYYQNVASNVPNVAQTNEIKKSIENPVIVSEINPIGKDNTTNQAILYKKNLLKQYIGKIIKANPLGIKHIPFIEKEPSFVKAVLSVQADTVKALSNNEKLNTSSRFSINGFICFIVALVLLIGGFFLFATLSQIDLGTGLAIFLIAGLAAIILDIVAIALSILGIKRNEDHKSFAEAVLWVNAILIAIILILALARI